MTKLVYRGIAYDADQKKPEERVYQRPQLVYRGVTHNGVRTTNEEKKPVGVAGLIYRGLKLA